MKIHPYSGPLPRLSAPEKKIRHIQTDLEIKQGKLKY